MVPCRPARQTGTGPSPCTAPAGDDGVGRPRIPSDELTLKADLAEELDRPPEVIVLGGSRSLRFEPAYIEQACGHPAFNAGVRNGRPEEAWGLAHYLHDLFPDVRPRYLWLVHVNLLRAWDRVSPPLVLDGRFCRYFPDDFIAEQEPLMPSSTPRTLRPATSGGPRWAPDGHLEWSRADQTPLSVGVRLTVDQWVARNDPTRPRVEERPSYWLEQTLGYMNALDAQPVLVMMPVQPDALERIGPQGYWKAHDQLLAHLRELESSYRFTLVDLTRIESFGGDPFDFYDGYHPRVANTRRIVDEILERYPDAFD